MLFLVILDYLATLNSIVTYLTDFRLKVVSIPYRTIYTVEGLRVNDEQYIASIEPMTLHRLYNLLQKQNSFPLCNKATPESKRSL